MCFDIYIFVIALWIAPVIPNPCDNNFRTLPFDDDRYLNNVVDESYTLIDDVWLREGWYKLSKMMLEETPSTIYRCGTKYPIWLNGSLPSDMYTQVNRTACVLNLFSDCFTSFDLQIAKCDSYYMYYLKPTRVFKTAYCFGTGVEGDKPMFVPQGKPKVTATLVEVQIRGVNINESVFICEFEESTTENLLYKVYWYMNRNSQYTTQVGNGSQNSSLHLTEDVFTTQGFSLGTNISCSFTAYVVENGPRSVPSDISEQLFVGIEILTPSLVFDVQENDVSKRSIKMRSTIPIACYAETSCNIPFITYVPDQETEGECQGLGFETSACGVNINSSTFNLTATLPITAHDNGQYNTKRNYQVYLRTNELLENRIWRNYVLPSISVTLTSTSSSTSQYSCKIYNDPHFRSFDGRYFDDHTDGTKVLYKNELFDTEVQIKYTSCYHSNIKCICGIAVRAGYDVYTYYVCDTYKIGYRYCSEYSRSFTVIWEQDTLKIHFDYGSYLIVSRQSTLTLLNNAFIFPTINDKHNTKGLCGTYNGNPNDDFKKRDGSITNLANFLQDWRVDETEDLFSDSFDTANLQPYTFNLCVCENSTVDEAIHAGTGKITEMAPCKQNGAATCRRGRIVGSHPRCALLDRRRRSNKKLPEMPAVFIRNIFTETNIVRQKREILQSWTVEEAEEICSRRFSETDLYHLCLQVTSSSTDLFLQACVSDIQLMNSTNWIESNIDSMSTDCVEETRRNITLLQLREEDNALFDEINDRYCHFNCSNRGVCTKDGCICENQSGGPDCSIDLSIPPTMQELYNGGLCDSNEQDCTAFEVFGGAFAESPYLLCKSQFFKMNQFGEREFSDLPYISNPTFVTFVELYCKLSSSRKRRSSNIITSNDFIFGYAISVTNDGETYSENKDLFVYNSECQAVESINGTYKFTLIDGYCFIDNQCVANGQTDPHELCYFCDSSTKTREWTVNQTKTECQSFISSAQTPTNNMKTDTTHADDSISVILASTISGFALLIIIVIAAVVLVKKSGRYKSSIGDSTIFSNPDKACQDLQNRKMTFQRPLTPGDIQFR